MPGEASNSNDKQTPTLTTPDPNPGESFYYAGKPNQMTFHVGGDTGKERTICVKGRGQEAGKLLVEGDWEVLARFPE